MSENLAQKLAEFSSKGYVVAPAGYGKTHLIALSVKASFHRQLILTHTFAGVNSIKNKMRMLEVPLSKYQVDTIASWALRLSLAYPQNSGWSKRDPSHKEWNKLYEACQNLLEKKFIRELICSSYAGVYIDEYQDCSELQHSLVYKLADFLPCRILGDPLQAIFDFADKPVDWNVSIYPHFQYLGELETPWRWNNAGAYELGEWLKKARVSLIQGGKIDLYDALPQAVTKISIEPQNLIIKQRSVLHNFLADAGTVIALHGGNSQSKNKTHNLARSMGGKFSSIEEVECNELFKFLKKLQAETTVKGAFLLVLDFAKKCFTGINKILTAGTKRGEIVKQTKNTRYPALLNAANFYLDDPTSNKLRNFFYLIKENFETSIYRRDLFNRFLNILDIHISKKTSTLLESAHAYQRKLRHLGRPIQHTKLIGTTLLVKGLEYDHSVILDADSLTTKELYVAITRGAKSLTIITSKKCLPAV